VRETAATLLLLVVIVAEPAARILGADWPLVPGALALVAFTLVNWPLLPRSARIVSGLAAIGAAIFVVDGAPWSVWAGALHLPLFLATFITVVGLLRQVGLRSSMMHRAGRALIGWRGAKRYVAVSLGSLTLSLVLLIGVIGLVGSMIMARGGPIDGNRAEALRALARGYGLMVMLSPLSMPFAIVATTVEAAHWPAMLVYLVPVAVAAWAAGWATTRSRRQPVSDPPPAEPGDLAALFRVLGIVVLIVCSVVLLDRYLLPRLVDAVVLTVFLVSLVWLALMALGGRLRSGERWQAWFIGGEVEMILLAASIFFGEAIVTVLPFEAAATAIGALDPPAWIYPPVIAAVFIGLGLAAIPPVFSMIILASALPHAALGLSPAFFAAACLVSWSLTALSSPFNAATLTLARVSGVSSFHVAFVWNGRWIALCVLALTLWLGLMSAVT